MRPDKRDPSTPSEYDKYWNPLFSPPRTIIVQKLDQTVPFVYLQNLQFQSQSGLSASNN